MKFLNVYLIAPCLLFLSACNKEPVQGDLVTWKVTPSLIYKTELGQPRKILLWEDGTRKNRPWGRYLGNFPIDYVPTKYPNLSQDEADKLTKGKNNAHTVEFDLAMRGAIFTPDDRSIFGEFVDKNQIKVEITPYIYQITPEPFHTEADAKEGKYDTHISKKYNLDCYIHNKEVVVKKKLLKYQTYLCIGKNTVHRPPVIIDFIANDMTYIFAVTRSPELGVTVNWRVDESNLKNWKEIDTAIWRLIDTWNVSPLS